MTAIPQDRIDYSKICSNPPTQPKTPRSNLKGWIAKTDAALKASYMKGDSPVRAKINIDKMSEVDQKAIVKHYQRKYEAWTTKGGPEVVWGQAFYQCSQLHLVEREGVGSKLKGLFSF